MSLASLNQRALGKDTKSFAIDDIAIGSLLMVAALFINKLGLAGNVLFFLLLGVMAAGRTKMAFDALALGILGLCANQAIVLKSAVWAYARFALLLGLSTRFFAFDQASIRYSLFAEARYIALCLFCVVACFTSLAANNRPEIATLKVFLFWLSLSGVWSAVACMRASKTDVAPWMVKITAAACGLNILSLILGIGNNFRDAGNTHGLYNLGFYHSQTVGPACALMITYLTSVWLFTAYRNRWICGPIIVVLLYSMYLSGSRTGILTLLTGVGAIFLFSLMWRGNRLKLIRLNMSRSQLILSAAAAVMLLIVLDIGAGGRISRSATTFLTKNKKDVEAITVTSITSSRQGLIDRAMENFRLSPMVGNGFQMYADREVTKGMTIMTSQVEKGFLPAAILEETGLIGTFFFVVFLGQCLRYYFRERNIPGIAAFTALLAMNFGECSFFSFAGQGGLYWMFVAAADLLGMNARVEKHSTRPQPTLRSIPHVWDRAAAL